MKARIISFCSILIFLASALGTAQTAEVIITKAIAAEGGSEKSSFNTLVALGKVSIPMMGIEGEHQVYLKRQYKCLLKISLKGREIIQASDGTECWMLDSVSGSGEPTKMPPEIAKAFLRGSDFDGPYYDMGSKGTSAELIGQETVKGVVTNHVKISYKDGHSMDLFFSEDTGLLYKTYEVVVGPNGGESEIIAFFTDYRDVQGAKYPFHILHYNDDLEMTVEIAEYQINVEIDDSFFEMPKSVMTPGK